jgi:hypothetical protein
MSKSTWVARRTLMKDMSWLVFGCSLALLLSASSVAYAMDGFWVCRGLPFVYEMKVSSHIWTLLAVPPVFRPLALASDMAVAFVVSGLIGLFVSRFGKMQRVPRIMFLLAVLLFGAANVIFIFIWSGPMDMPPHSPGLLNDWASYYYCLMLVPSLALTISGLTWSLVSARRRRPQPSSVTQ